jgi:ectoine hydroxylase-related dioxygenase (phytanoyl-CoA dioxygenase family)
MSTLELSSAQRHFFREKGYLRLERAVSQAQLRPLQNRIAKELSRRGMGASGRGMWRSIYELPVFQQVAKLSQLITLPDLEAQVIPLSVATAINALTTKRVISRLSQLLISPPKQGDWSLDNLNWHTDVSASDDAQIPGIQAFVLVEDVEKRGGATLILSGSHLQTSNARTNSRIRDALGKGREGEAILKELNLSIVELYGNSGDVYLMDMRVLHTPSVNSSKQLRIVATIRFFFD